MSEIKNGYFYTKEHEWVSFEENVVTLGVTDYAQKMLGDVVFVDLPEVDAEITKDESFGVVESVKAVSDLYSPITGKVLEVNELLGDSPEMLNDDPYDEAWLVRIEPVGNVDQVIEELKQDLMTPEDYKEFLAEEEE